VAALALPLTTTTPAAPLLPLRESTISENGRLRCAITSIFTMEASLKELTKLEKLVSNSGSSKGKAPSIDDSLDALLRTLRETKESIHAGTSALDTYTKLASQVDSTKKDVDERQKEVYNSLNRFGKSLDKVRCGSII
jgi:hypothetical protein